MKTEVCKICRGTKKYAPMGGIMVTCKPCNGVGHIEKKEIKEQVIALDSEDVKNPDCDVVKSETITINPNIDYSKIDKRSKVYKEWKHQQEQQEQQEG
jgi:hypothetical protein